MGRDAELELIADRLAEARNTRLEGPRRFGKTSLLRAALADAARGDAIAIEVNFLGCVTPADVALRIERAYAAQLDSPLRRWFDGVVRTLHPTIRASPGGVGVDLAPGAGGRGLAERLELPRRLFERTGRRCAVAFDEFQEVVRIDAALPGAFRAELEHHRGAAGYIFSGSHPGLMRELFSDRRHAFFAQATPVTVGPLSADALADFVLDRFTAARRDPGEALGPLLDAAQGHPQRAMLLAHHLFQTLSVGQTADVTHWIAALAAARAETSGEVQVLWDASSTLERRVLKVVAARSVPLGGRDAQQRFGLGRSGSAQTAIARLARDGQIVEDPSTRTGFRVVDPFVEGWLREEG